MQRKQIRRIIERHRGRPGATLAILMDIQSIQGYLSQEALRVVAEETDSSLVDIFGIVTSQPHFNLGPSRPRDSTRIEEERAHEARLEVRCRHCNHDLLDTRWLVDGLPSIKVTVASRFHHGWFRLSSRTGTCKFVAEHELSRRGVADFFCPHCHSQLFSSASCIECGSPMVPMLSRDGTLIPVCSSPPESCRHGARDVQGTDGRREPRHNEASTTRRDISTANAPILEAKSER